MPNSPTSLAANRATQHRRLMQYHTARLCHHRIRSTAQSKTYGRHGQTWNRETDQQTVALSWCCKYHTSKIQYRWISLYIILYNKRGLPGTNEPWHAAQKHLKNRTTITSTSHGTRMLDGIIQTNASSKSMIILVIGHHRQLTNKSPEPKIIDAPRPNESLKRRN